MPEPVQATLPGRKLARLVPPRPSALVNLRSTARSRTNGLGLTRLLAVALLAASPFLGCGFFEELGADDDDDDGGDDGDTGSTVDMGSDGPCGAEDDFCISQDELSSCSPDTGDVTELNCAIACGSFMNFTCVHVTGGRHGCWCVSPGDQPIDGCVGLETCLASCGEGATTDCGNGCFERATYSTIRLYGALVHCAEQVCRDTCLTAPESCSQCIALARTGMIGDCAVERAVCDNDQPDDVPWP